MLLIMCVCMYNICYSYKRNEYRDAWRKEVIFLHPLSPPAATLNPQKHEFSSCPRNLSSIFGYLILAS